MRKQYKHVLDKAPFFEPDRFVALLNSHEYSGQITKALEIIAKMNNRDEREKAPITPRQVFGKSTCDPNLDEQRAEAQLNKVLRRFLFFPWFFLHGSDWPARLRSVRLDRKTEKLKRQKFTPLRLAELLREEYCDSEIVLGLVTAGQLGVLGELIRCTCGNWLFRRTAKTRFCSAKCREKNYKSSEEWKAYRREYMKAYYKLQHSGKVK